MSDSSLLIGDIGGTNARFALADSREPGFFRQETYICADFETADSAIRTYLKKVDVPSPDVICIAAAGPVVKNSIQITNNNWAIDAAEISAEYAGASVCLLNDFEAIAYSIPFLDVDDSQAIGLPETRSTDARNLMFGIVGPGTGLGYAGLCLRDSELIPISGEGGHQGFAPESQLQMDVLAMLRQRFDRVSNEMLVSGPGIQNIYWALTKIHGERQRQITAAEIFARAENAGDQRAEESIQLFFELLGQVAGNLAISMSTVDGVYLAGGIAKRYPHKLINSRFRDGFENKGRHRSLMERIPTRLITHADPGLLGASFRAIEMAGK